MKHHIIMPKIPQFRDIVKKITHLTRYKGEDETGDPIYNNNKLPVLRVTGSVKLHGTCAMVCYNAQDGMWEQSKNRIITPGDDNAEFSMFVRSNLKSFTKLIERVIKVYSISPKRNTITIFGEWAGKGIQAGVGISKIERNFFIFGLKISPHNEDITSYWLDSNIFNTNDYNNIWHIKHFKTYDFKIDFEKPQEYKSVFKEIVDEIEAECPVAKEFNVSGIGEGVVFTLEHETQKLRFKVKGKKHIGGKKIKQQKSKELDQEKINKVVYDVTHMRLEQMIQESFDILNGGEIDIKGMSKYLKAVKDDVIAEDLDIIIDAGLTMKNINKTLHSVARDYLLEKLENTF